MHRVCKFWPILQPHYIVKVTITVQTVRIIPISDGQRSEITSSYLGHQTALAYVRTESSSNRCVDFTHPLSVINLRPVSLLPLHLWSHFKINRRFDNWPLENLVNLKEYIYIYGLKDKIITLNSRIPLYFLEIARLFSQLTRYFNDIYLWTYSNYILYL